MTILEPLAKDQTDMKSMLTQLGISTKNLFLWIDYSSQKISNVSQSWAVWLTEVVFITADQQRSQDTKKQTSGCGYTHFISAR